ncbi:MAG TPA: ATP-binding domain-containing protein [Pseudonocardiaceae bacterium]|nr:ATP-binding domain-containing protein [Pseudonocardiaceae bacterium]
MSQTSVRQDEIAVEQQHVDRVYTRVAEVRSETEAMRERGYQLAHGADHEAIFEQARMLQERDVMVRYANRMLQELDAEHEGLVFGRLDLGDADKRGETIYVGRLGLRDENFDNLVVDWRAPAAGAFYQATAEHPMGVLRRRVIRCSREQVLDIDDDVLAPDALPEDIRIVGEGALMASIGRTRGDTMRDIVATIQREQDEAIRAPLAGVTEITGGPGTGKTAVALHRAAFLLYQHRRRMTGAGVLVIGPSPVFTNYISRVLPSMGEESVELRALGEVLDGVRATHLDGPEVAAVKGSPRILKVLRKAARLAPPGVPTDLRISYRGEVLRLSVEDLESVRQAMHRRGGPPNRSRVDAAEALLEALWRKAEAYAADDGGTGRFRPKHDELVTEIGERLEFHRFLVAWWPVLTPTDVLNWLGDRDLLAGAAGRTLNATEIDLLAKSWADPGRGPSVADIALLDELRFLLGEPRRRRRSGTDAAHPEGTGVAGFPGGDGFVVPEGESHRRRPHYDEYAHLVLDEAQDLSPMQWRMIGRRGKHASWTIVGDPLQSSWADPAEARTAKDTALRDQRTRREFTLRTNYRNSAEIFALAARVVGGLAGQDELPHAVRTTGIEPAVRTVSRPELPDAVREAARELLAAVDGTVGVITTMDGRDEAAEWVTGISTDRLRVVGSLDAKGLEYDAVVVATPEELIAESPTGRRALYVALTRATQRLTVLTTGDSWLI